MSGLGRLRRDLEKLEAETLQGRECSRCSGVLSLYVNDELVEVSKDGRNFTPEEAGAYVGEEKDGCCPLCGSEATEIV